MPEKELPFLTVFARYRPAPELLPALEGWLVASAVVESSTRVMDAKLRCPEPPPESLLQAVGEAVRAAYGLNGLRLTPLFPGPVEEAPPIEETAPPPEQEALPPVEEVPVQEEVPQETEEERLFRQTREMRRKAMKQALEHHEKEAGFRVKRIYGPRQIKKAPIPMNTLELNMGTVTVEGDVFTVEHKELTKRNAWVISFDITDYTSSIRVNKFMPGDEGAPIVQGVKKGMRLRIAGRLNLNRFDNDMVLEPLIIETAEKPVKTDDAPEKRVELHQIGRAHV